MDSTTFQLAPLRLRSTGLLFLGTYWIGYRGNMEFPVPLLTLLQLRSYLVPCISARIFIIPRLQNIHWRIFYISGEIFSLCIELPNCYSVSSYKPISHSDAGPKLTFREHISHALPTEMIFHLLQSIPSERLLRFPGESEYHTLEIIFKWLEVSVSECNPQTLQTKKSNLYLPGTWFRATERLV